MLAVERDSPCKALLLTVEMNQPCTTILLMLVLVKGKHPARPKTAADGVILLYDNEGMPQKS
jgi:hypothetical protein